MKFDFLKESLEISPWVERDRQESMDKKKKKKMGGDHKLWKLHASSKDENNQVSRLVFTWAAGQLQKKCTIMAKLPQSRGSL